MLLRIIFTSTSFNSVNLFNYNNYKAPKDQNYIIHILLKLGLH